MNATSTVPVTAATLEVPGARLYYEVRGQGPLVVLVGAPMDARSFAPLADLLAADHTVLTTDPRGINRSPVDDRDRDSTPELRADDLFRLLSHFGRGPAAVLGSSGGAVSALALAQIHPEQVHTVIAHEPPLDELLDDRQELREQTEDMIATYLSGDVRGAWAKFLATANIHLPDEVFEAMVGERDAQTAADEHFQFAHMLRATTRWQPDVAVLRSAPTRIVVGIGDDSSGQLCDRTSTALAAALGVAPTMFPGGHIGFVEDPERFATRLRVALYEG
ncbi:alpha/beta hydrolase [Micromonospora sp. C51]|uniref:alpha/beta fold hydrolase n=1 Tax=Micromonospora sp. C51 TaxID=2824879 RepID=UPI001B382313|nr:alpha/beta hydrolase [Micromonospora sp. C51]MBQ1047515.1 alpha/beta hydrolase [Micromonospora sp. C51]